MQYVIQNGTQLSIADIDQIHGKLPFGTYNLCFHPMKGWYLTSVETLKVPKKIYGNNEIIDRSIAVYKDKDRNFGLLLYGLKGSGKTLTMKKIALELNQPIIFITDNFGQNSESAIQFLSNACLGDCTILIDEFEKKFSEGDNAPLTLLDGPYPTHHFFILTANESRINNNLVNRPGRIYYQVHYTGLDDAIIADVANDMLEDKSKMNELISVCEEIPNISFDMLLSIIHDMNKFNESAKDVLKWFQFSRESQYLTIYQKVGTTYYDKPVLDSQWLDSKNSRNNFWVRIKISPSHLELEEDVYIDVSLATKVRKNIYKYVGTVIPDDIECADTDEEKLKFKQELEAKGVVFKPDTFEVPYELEFRYSGFMRTYIYM